MGAANAHKPMRNTPTGVGKTKCVDFLAFAAQKHPHGRGEDLFVTS